MADDLKKMAGDLGKVTSAVGRIGVGIDTQTLAIVSGAFQLIGGSASVIKGLRTAKEAYNAWRAAEGMAHLAKWGPWAPAVQAMAGAGAQAMGYAIEETVRTVHTGTGQDRRAIAGGNYYGRRRAPRRVCDRGPGQGHRADDPGRGTIG